jgi:hypothetical protein
MNANGRTMRLHRLLAPILTLLAAGCTDRAVFVTSTDIGINANVTTEQVHIGYGRTELFQGPSYPNAGSVPEVVGYLGSNLEVFSPKIHQVYATGKAADLVTQPEVPEQTAEESDSLEGARRPCSSAPNPISVSSLVSPMPRQAASSSATIGKKSRSYHFAPTLPMPLPIAVGRSPRTSIRRSWRPSTWT